MSDDATEDVLIPHQGEQWDAPNQQVVTGSAPWEEGTGGEPGDTGVVVDEPAADQPDQEAAADNNSNLDEMTKEQLLEYGQQLGISPMNAAMSKGEIREAIDAHLAG